MLYWLNFRDSGYTFNIFYDMDTLCLSKKMCSKCLLKYYTLLLPLKTSHTYMNRARKGVVRMVGYIGPQWSRLAMFQGI